MWSDHFRGGSFLGGATAGRGNNTGLDWMYIKGTCPLCHLIMHTTWIIYIFNLFTVELYCFFFIVLYCIEYARNHKWEENFSICFEIIIWSVAWGCASHDSYVLRRHQIVPCGDFGCVINGDSTYIYVAVLCTINWSSANPPQRGSILFMNWNDTAGCFSPPRARPYDFHFSNGIRSPFPTKNREEQRFWRIKPYVVDRVICILEYLLIYHHHTCFNLPRSFWVAENLK